MYGDKSLWTTSLDSAVKAMKRKPYVQLKIKTQVPHKSSVWSHGRALQAGLGFLSLQDSPPDYCLPA